MLKTGVFVFLLNDYIKNKYPERYQNLLISLSYNFFYFLSKIQILLMKLVAKINEKIEESPNLRKMKNGILLFMKSKPKLIENIEYIKNGEYIKANDISDNDADFDFILYSWLDDENEYVNKRIMYEKNDIVTSCELSETKFMLMEINVGENKYKIDLKTDRYNFYVVGNVLTKQFFIYYLKQFLKLNDLINNVDKISIKIIDDNVNIIEFDFSDKNENIVLEKNGYKVLNCK